MTCSRRSFLGRLSGAVSALGATRVFPAASTSRRPPSTIHIMCDELGYYELSCMGHPHIKTPTIDRMAAEGIRLTQALGGRTGGDR